MSNENDDSLELEKNDSDLDANPKEEKEIEKESQNGSVDESSFEDFSVEDFFAGLEDGAEDAMMESEDASDAEVSVQEGAQEDSEPEEVQESSEAKEVQEDSEAEEVQEDSEPEEAQEDSEPEEVQESSKAEEVQENSESDAESSGEDSQDGSLMEDSSDDFDDLFALLGMGDADEQEIFSNMMDSIPDSEEEEGIEDSSADGEEAEFEEMEDESPALAAKNDIYSEVLSAVGSLEDKEQEAQIMSELEDIEDRTDSKKKPKKSKKEKKEKEKKKQPKEKKDISTLLFGEEEPETPEEKLAREKKEAQKASKKEEKARKKEEKKKLAEEKKKQAKEKADLKKSKELESMDPEDLKPVNIKALVFCAFAFILLALFVIMGTNMFHYALTVKKATDYFDRKKYNMAYEEIIGVEVKEEDEELRDKIYTVMYVERAYLSYNIYVDMGSYDKALNMLLSGLAKYDEYYPQGMALGIEEDMDYCRNKIVNALYDDYGMSLNDAYDMIALDDDQYQLQMIEKSKDFKENK